MARKDPLTTDGCHDLGFAFHLRKDRNPKGRCILFVSLGDIGHIRALDYRVWDWETIDKFELATLHRPTKRCVMAKNMWKDM